jgi:hypothetical protein
MGGVTTPLEQILADWAERAQTLRRCGHGAEAETLEALLSEVRVSAEDWLVWLSEDDAMLRSGKSRDWFRGRFPDWERRDLARRDGRKRRYRAVVVPQRLNLEAAREQGRRDAEAAA